jgi:hypothetical protein
MPPGTGTHACDIQALFSGEPDIISWLGGHVIPDVKTGVRGLVIGYILPGNPQPVDGVMHEGIEAVPGRDGRGVDTEGLIAGGSPDHLLPPVPEKIRTEGWSCLGSVV